MKKIVLLLGVILLCTTACHRKYSVAPRKVVDASFPRGHALSVNDPEEDVATIQGAP